MVVETELSSGRMNPRVGSGKILPDFGGLDRVGTSGFLFCTDHFLVPRILNSDLLIFYDIFYLNNNHVINN